MRFKDKSEEIDYRFHSWMGDTAVVDGDGHVVRRESTPASTLFKESWHFKGTRPYQQFLKECEGEK